MTKQTTKTENSHKGDAAAQIWVTDQDGRRYFETEKRRASYSQYAADTPNCGGEWCWQARVSDNWRIVVSGVVGTEDEAREMCEFHAGLSDKELIELAAREHLEALKEIGYTPRTSIDYATGYDDGYKAALSKLRAFMDNEQTEGE